MQENDTEKTVPVTTEETLSESAKTSQSIGTSDLPDHLRSEED